MHRFHACLLVVFWAVIAAVPTDVMARENHALLIGASTYPNLDERFWLVGPANDVDLVRTYLTTNTTLPFAPQNVVVLADGVTGGQDPTLAAIRREMAALAGRVSPGDFVYLHFSGHGTQAPAQKPGQELDGLDELFLPVDAGLWNDSIGAVENALIDDEIGEMVDALRAAGATVWAVFDTCHSGTITRAANAPDDLRLRQIDPTAALGVPLAQMEAVGGQLRALSPRAPDEPGIEIAPNNEGGFVAFYAAQSNEATPEKRLPRGKPGRRSQGVFTYTLFEAMAARPDATYRQLGQEILRRYATERRARSTPMFVGDLDARVFGSGLAAGVRQWPLTQENDAVTLTVGRLHGLTEGMRLAVVASPLDADVDALGLLEITAVAPFSATLGAVKSSDNPSIDLNNLPAGAFVRQIEQVLDFGLTVARPDSSTQVDALFAYAQRASLFTQRVTFVDPGAAADIALRLDTEDQVLIVAPGDGMVDPGGDIVAIRLTDKSPQDAALALSDTLHRIARVRNVLRLGGRYSDGASGVQVSLQTRSPEAPELRALDPVPVPRLIPDDEVHIQARNDLDVPSDINVLYIGSDYSITHMFKGRLHPGDILTQGLLRITDAAFGRDRVLIFLTSAKPQTALEDFGFLAQDTLETTRNLPVSDFASALIEAGFAETTRAATPLGNPKDMGPRPQIIMYDIDTLPAD